MAQEETNLLLKWGVWAAGGLFTLISLLGGRVVKKHDEEIKSIKDGLKEISAKVDTKVDKETWEQNRKESRENIIDLHDKIEQIGRDGESRHRELMNILLEQRNRHRSGDR